MKAKKGETSCKVVKDMGQYFLVEKTCLGDGVEFIQDFNTKTQSRGQSANKIVNLEMEQDFFHSELGKIDKRLDAMRLHVPECRKEAIKANEEKKKKIQKDLNKGIAGVKPLIEKKDDSKKE